MSIENSYGSYLPKNSRIEHLRAQGVLSIQQPAAGSNCDGRVLRIAIARCESELVCPIVPACVVNIQVEDIICYEAKI